MSDLITQRSGSDTSIDGLYYQNGDGARARGAEFEVQAELPGRVRGRVAHAFQSVHDKVTETTISNSPGQLATFVIDAPLARSGLRAGFNAYFIGERRTVRGVDVSAAFVSDLTLSRPQPDKGLALALSVHNIFDIAYGDPGSEEHRQRVIPQDGRTLRVRVTWRF